MVQVGNNLVGKGVTPIAQAKLYDNPHQLRCTKCMHMLDMRHGKKLNDYVIQVPCPSCKEIIPLYKKRKNTQPRRDDGSVISPKKDKLSKKQRKALRKQGKSNG